MKTAFTERTQTIGPAIGTSGAALGGSTVSIPCPGGKYVGTISVRLRSRTMAARIQRGSVAVQVAITPRSDDGVPTDTLDRIDDRAADWAGISYVSTGRGATWHPNLFINKDDLSAVRVRVWNRDDLDSTRRIIVDIAVTFADAPVAGQDSVDYSPGVVGTGTSRRVAGADPTAPSEAELQAATGLLWRVRSVSATLVADSNAATRVVEWTATKGATAVKIARSAATQVADTTRIYVLSPMTSLSYAAQDTLIDCGMGADLYLLGGESVETTTANIQAGDNYGAPQAIIEEWVVPEVAAS